jgi:hypothetical protein
MGLVPGALSPVPRAAKGNDKTKKSAAPGAAFAAIARNTRPRARGIRFVGFYYQLARHSVEARPCPSTPPEPEERAGGPDVREGLGSPAQWCPSACGEPLPKDNTGLSYGV